MTGSVTVTQGESENVDVTLLSGQDPLGISPQNPVVYCQKGTNLDISSGQGAIKFTVKNVGSTPGMFSTWMGNNYSSGVWQTAAPFEETIDVGETKSFIHTYHVGGRDTQAQVPITVFVSTVGQVPVFTENTTFYLTIKPFD